MAKPKEQPAQLRTVAELDAAEKNARARKQAALKKLAADGRHPTAVADLRQANADLHLAAEERKDQREIAAMQANASRSEAELAALAKARKTAAGIPARIIAQGEACAEAVRYLERVAEGVEAVEASQRTADAAVYALGGPPRKLEMTRRASRAVSLGLALRPILLRLSSTRLLEPFIKVTVPAEPDTNPLGGAETHAEAQARVAALPRTPETVFAAAAANTERLLAELLGAPIDNSAKSNGQPSWHGRPDNERHDDFASVMQRGAGNGLREDTERQRERRDKRVKDSARAIDRDDEGKIILLRAEPT